MKLSRFVVPIAAIAFGLATITPSMSASFSRGSSTSSMSSTSRSFTPSAPAYRPSTPSFPRAGSDSSTGFTKPAIVAPPAAASNNGFSKPGAVASTPPAAASNNGFSKPGTVASTTPSVGAPKPPVGALAAAQQKTMSSDSLKAYQAQRADAKQPPLPVSTTDLRQNASFNSARQQYGSMDAYMGHRQGAYASYRSNLPPGTTVVINNIHPNYGMYDSSFLTGMIMGAAIIDIHNAAWLSAQQNQAWYPQYMSDLRQQAQTNAELQTRLDMLQQQMAAAQTQGVSVNPNQLPPGADPSVAIAPEAMMADFSQTPSSNGNSHLWLIVFAIVIIGGGVIYFIKR